MSLEHGKTSSSWGLSHLQELEYKLSQVIAELDQSRARQRAVAALLAGNFSEPRTSTDQLKKQMAAVQELKVCQLMSPPPFLNCDKGRLPCKSFSFQSTMCIILEDLGGLSNAGSWAHADLNLLKACVFQ